MSFFSCDPESIIARVQASAIPVRQLTLKESMLKGALAFCVVSIAGFAPWAFGGRTIGAKVGEGGLYAICALAFMITAGILLRPLVMGSVPLGRFYGLFSTAFFLYSIGWCAAWFGLVRTLGMRMAGLIGILAGTVLMGIVIVQAFSARKRAVTGITLLFVLHTVGYFIGDVLYAWSYTESAHSLLDGVLGKKGVGTFGKLMWGVAYGLGMGAGIGALFHAAQEEVRSRLAVGKS